MTDRLILGLSITFPFASSLIQRVKVKRWHPGLREQRFSQRTLGSIGKTLCTRYTDVVLSFACLSTKESYSTKKLASAICTPTSYPSPCFYMESASSKSLAVKGSIVKIRAFLKSYRWVISSSGMTYYAVIGSMRSRNFASSLRTYYWSYSASMTLWFLRRELV